MMVGWAAMSLDLTEFRPQALPMISRCISG
jgi:hypothetical protein